MTKSIQLRGVAALTLVCVGIAMQIACGAALGALGDDCSADVACNSGLCDDKSFCASPVAPTDGKPCTADATCPTGDHCHTATGKCFSNASDGKGGNNACNSKSDCGADEVCGTNHICQG
jgi:hypothetical protein